VPRLSLAHALTQGIPQNEAFYMATMHGVDLGRTVSASSQAALSSLPANVTTEFLNSAVWALFNATKDRVIIRRKILFFSLYITLGELRSLVELWVGPEPTNGGVFRANTKPMGDGGF
jgi:hypothetical protein